ncbi:hypothetical protein [Finegoldia magna]|uniref:Uncharacterized protein n=1 Tax=Finegoldia magna ATCC 53516 TaxID=525282 RepID=D6S6E3_FINMA|nr:hypothetical protein [Finegoldia magna]EFH93647.1 hypothetical protein HMPREF0391_10015 [Finegoldia magna ATCC 53516]
MKFNLKRATATVLLAAMLVGSAPINVFAEETKLAPTKDNTSVRAVDTPDWEVSYEEANSEYWPLAAHNRLIEPSTGDFIKNPTIEYGGSYNYTDPNSKDREVIKLLYKTNSSPGGAWNKMLLKFDKTLYQMIDWDNNQTGAWKDPSTNRGPASPLHFKNGIMTFTRESRENVGSENVVSFDIDKAGFKTNVIEAPMHFVLKDQATLEKENLPKSIQELTREKEPIIQMRITDKKYERVRMNPTKHRNGYSTYTPSTVIPKKDYRTGLIPQSQQDNGSPWIFAQDSYISYDKNRGYVDLTIRHNKGDFLLTAYNYNPYIGLRTVMEDKFFNILAGSSYKKADGTEVAEDSNDKIADVFLLNADEDPYGKGATYENPITDRKIPVLRRQINDGKDGLKYIQVLGSDYKKTDYESNIKTQQNGKALDLLINGAAANSLKGVATVVRFYVQPDKFDKIVNDSDLLDMTFYTTFTMQTKTPKDTFTGKVDKDRKLKQGDELILDVGTDEFSGGAKIGDRKLTMEVGKRPHTVVFNAESNALGGTSLYWKDKTSYWWRIPYDMTLKEGTPIKIYMEGLKKPIKEVRFYKNKEEQAKGNSGDFFTIAKDAEKTGDMQYARFAGNLKSPHVAKTQNEASIPEIFTEDNIIHGHTKVGNAIVRATGVGENDTLLKQAYLTDQEDTFKTAGSGDNEEVIIDQKRSQAVIVNKKIEFGYEFSTKDAINPKDPLGATTGITNNKYKMIKDAPIGFTTEDFSINAVEKLPPIIEQVQAKVNFDLNGGYLGEDANDDNAKKPITKIAPLNENYRYNVDKETNFPTTELNKNYKANAFEGDNRRMVDDGSGKQVMASHTDQPLGTETYKSMFDKYNEELKKRLTEAQALPTGAGAPNAIRNAAISEAQQDIASFKVYVEKFYTSKGIDITKSQLWLREFPGKESQKDLKTENPKMDNKEFYGWTTKKVDTVDGYNKLQELTTEEQAKDTTNAYKFTENSPILSEMTVYAFYGPLRSQVTNPKQTYDQDDDKQYIEIAPEEGKNLPKNASYKLVKKNDDGSYTEVKGTSQTTTKDGRLVLDITDLPSDKFDPKEDYYIEATEVGKAPSYSTKPIKIDKVAPSFGEANKNMTIEQDAYGYQVKISAKASDDSGILRVYESENKDSGYYDKNASLKSADLNKHIYQQNGEDKTYSVIAIDKFGNKTTVKKSVEKKAEPLQLNADVPYEGDDFIYVSSEEGADIKIEVLNSDDSKAFEINTNLAYGDAEIDTLNDGSTFEFERGQTVIITASKGGKTAKLTLEVD